MFKKGQSGNPKGRLKGCCGRRGVALATLDRMMGNQERQRVLLRALGAEFDENPSKFFKTVIVPLLPKESKLDVGHDGIIEWKSLLGDGPGEKPRFDEKGLPIPGRYPTTTAHRSA
jgi:hypothetical protein